MAVPEEVVSLFLREVASRGLPEPAPLADGGFTVKMGGNTLTINLENIARDFARDRDEGRIARFVDRLVEMPSLVEPDWSEAEVGLRLAAEASDYQFGDAIHEQVSDSLCRVLAYVNPEGTQIMWVTPWMLERWGKSQEEAEEIARANMARLLEETEFHIEEVHGLPLGMFQTNSAFKASLIFSPNLKEVLGPKIGWPLLMVIPCRDFAYVFPEGNQDLLLRVGQVVVEEHDKSGYPISTEVFRLSDEGIEAIGEFRMPEDAGCQDEEEDEEGEDGGRMLPEESLGEESSSSADEQDAAEEMKTISYRGGVVRFRLPDYWEEEYQEEGGGTFYDEDGPGTLRLNIITVRSQEPITPERAAEMLHKRAEEKGQPVRRLDNGNSLFTYQESYEEEEDEEPQTVWYWEMANPVPPHHARYAVFSFAVPEDEAEDAEVVETVGMLQRELERCRFAPQIGGNLPEAGSD